MQSLLEEFVLSQIIVYILTFARVGTVMMLMPGVGDSFVSPNIRLLFAMAFAVVVSPITAMYVPEVINNAMFIQLLMSEIVIGLFIGTVARIFVAALDVAGMLISMSVGTANAMLFNPQMAGQGSLVGVFLSITGAMLLFATDLHHMLIFGMIDSYKTFPMTEGIPLSEDMAQTIAQAVTNSFRIGFFMAVPFMIVSLFLYIAMGILGRLMPQIQVFILALPLQIMLGMLVMILVFSTMMFYWLTQYDNAIQLFFMNL
jgi:flagellar biosynthetic protein FliR